MEGPYGQCIHIFLLSFLLQFPLNFQGIHSSWYIQSKRPEAMGAFHLVRTQFYMLSGPTHPPAFCM